MHYMKGRLRFTVKQEIRERLYWSQCICTHSPARNPVWTSFPVFVTVYDDGVYHTTSGGRFFMIDISVDSWSGVGAQTVGVVVGNVSPWAFWRRIVRYWHPLGCRAIEPRNPPQAGVMYTVLCGRCSVLAYQLQETSTASAGDADFKGGWCSCTTCSPHDLIVSRRTVIPFNSCRSRLKVTLLQKDQWGGTSARIRNWS